MIETDYLVIGAGASGMAFADVLLAESDADVVLVDRRHRPGGHWNDAYPFVRLHQPSAFYGVNSRMLGNDMVDASGPNAGYYERATGAEVCDYYTRVLDGSFLPSGRVRFYGMSECVAGRSDRHRIVSRMTGEAIPVRVRKKVVDSTYLETSIPSRHTPSFTVDPDARLVTPNDLIHLDEPASGFTVLGSGKTAMDTCTWLIGNGVSPEAIRWIKPREAWTIDRGFLQPLEQVANVIEGVSHEMQSAAEAESVTDLFRRLEACGQLHRIDDQTEPTMYRGAILDEAERASLRQIENVVRLGRVLHLGTSEIDLTGGRLSTESGQVYVDCTAIGLKHAPPRPIFETGRIVLQPLRAGLTPFNASIIGFVEAHRGDDTEKNRLCPPNIYPNTDLDWMPTWYTMTKADAQWLEEPDIAAWLEGARINVSSGLRAHMDEPRMQEAVTRLYGNRERALHNVERFMGEIRLAS
jgi:hypothetical protein